jgi:hypothetical protein
MVSKLHWETDPVVVLEGHILPVLPAGQELLCRLAMAQDHPPDPQTLDELLATFTTAEEHLRNAGAKYLEPKNIRLEGEDLLACITAADQVRQARQVLGNAIADYSDQGRLINGSGALIADMLANNMQHKVNAALDAFRRVFITTVLTLQEVHAEQTEIALRELSDISETIFFIGINASVEAARVGDEGRGFTVISEDIRRLAQNARKATADLSATFVKN